VKNMKKIFVIICILMLFSTLPMATGLVNNSNNNIQISDNYETDWWKISRHDPTHSGYSFSTAPNTSNLVGTMTIGPDYVPNGEPLVYDGKIYITSFKEEGLFGFGWIHCFNVSTGGLVWSHKFESSLFAGVAGIPAINGNNIFLSVVYDFSSVLECRDKDTGTLLWDKDFYEYSIMIKFMLFRFLMVLLI
jgi:outer membrane protein assembly factor BamB